MKLLTTLIVLSFSFIAHGLQVQFPFEKMGWTNEEAATHLLNRFCYGPRSGEVAIVSKHIDDFIASQLFSLPQKDERHQKYSINSLTVEEIGQTYPAPGVRLIFGGLQRSQINNDYRKRAGGMSATAPRSAMGGDSTRGMGNQNDLYRRIVNAEQPNEQYKRFTAFAEQRFGWKDFSDLFYQLMAQKFDRAIHSENQLEEVMVDFWFNHFNVSIHGVNDQATQVFSYERDAIRPHALGNFRELLHAVAKHPAMLLYLDNNRSNADEGRATLVPFRSVMETRYEQASKSNPSLKQFVQLPGVNENYARELLELHTLGVSAGYTQRDVEEIARAFTGWKVSPLIYPVPTEMQTRLRKGINQMPHAVLKNGFYFDPSRHDAEMKIVLGDTLPAGVGSEEGEQILNKVAMHPSTANFICEKLAKRFVSDNPSPKLIEKMANTFLQTEGDIKQVLYSMLQAEEFWDRAMIHSKIKTPFELIVSAVRETNANVTDYHELIRWCTRIGQPLYAFQAPTGYPEDADFWVNGAALVHRINFTTELASQNIKGVRLATDKSEVEWINYLGSPEFQRQ